MTAFCARIHAFADGEIVPDQRPAFQDHLAGCFTCQAELEDVLLLDALGASFSEETASDLAMAGTPLAVEVATAPLRRQEPAIRRPWLLRPGTWAVVTLAAAAAAALVVGPRKPPQVTPSTVLAAVAPDGTRPIAARVGHPVAAAHRPLRSGARPAPADALERLEAKGELHAAGVAWLWAGEATRADETLARAGNSPQVLGDRAAAALVAGRFDDAGLLAQQALAARSDHGPALWNLALSLDGRGRKAEAAAVFDRVAALDEPGWAHEARQRAATLRK